MVAFFGLMGCEKDDDAEVVLSFATGTAFGMCAGYCLTETVIQEDSVVFTRSGWLQLSQFPDRICGSSLAPDQWSLLLANTDRDAFLSLPATIGCPDCADGGAEWLEIRENGRPLQRVTLEFGKDVPEISRLMQAIRAIRDAREQSCQ
ncbi:MAG: hypothetical protein AAGB22_08820 [Bacteroidota bacterium]